MLEGELGSLEEGARLDLRESGNKWEANLFREYHQDDYSLKT